MPAELTLLAATSAPGPGRAPLTLHVAMSLGWLGLHGALMTLALTGPWRKNPAARSGIASVIAVIAWWVLIPVVSLFAS